MKPLRSHLSYANVMATIALLLALGGTSYAAVQQINGKTIKKRSITAKKVKRNSLGGGEINESKLGPVPSAAAAATADEARDADTLDGMHAASLKVSCTASTIPYGGVCFEASSRSAQDFPAASTTCGDLGGTLPTVPQLQGFRQLAGVTLASPEMSGDMFSDVDQFLGEIGYFQVNDGGSVNTAASSTATAFRCVFDRSN